MEYDETFLDTFIKHTEPHDEPDDVIDTFVRLANALVGPFIIDGDRRELTPEDVEHNPVFDEHNPAFDNVGALIQNGDSVDPFAGLCINYRWWDRVDREAQLVLFVHEATHFEDKTHDPSFWETALDVYREAKEQYALVETIFGTSMDWEKADWYFITHADFPNVETSHESVPERRQRIADSLGHDSFDALKLTTDRINLIDYEETTMVPLKNLEVSMRADYELHGALADWLSRSNGDVYYDMDDFSYDFEPPSVVEGDDGYDVRVGADRVAFLRRTLGKYHDSVEIPVRVIEDAPE